MSEKNSKTKFLYVLIAILFVGIIVVLTLIILTNKNDKNDNSDEKNISLSGSNLDSEDISNISGETIPDKSSDELTPTEELKVTDAAVPDKTTSEVTVILGKYKGLEIDEIKTVITEEDVENNLEQLKMDKTELVLLPDRAFELGDMAIVTFEGEVDGTKPDALTGICLQAVLGSGILPEEIETSIVGRNIGDKYEIDVYFPETYTAVPEAKGKIVHFYIELVDGFAFDIPEINDDFIKKETEYSSLKEYREKEKVRLQQEADANDQTKMMNMLKRKVVDETTFEGPIDEKIKQNYVLRIQRENEEIFNNYMMDAPTYYSLLYDIPEEEYQQLIMDEESLKVKYNYVLDEIAKKENISNEEAEKLIMDSAVKTPVE